ncbi:MAG: heme exporter protein CcmD [Thalassobaculaceae bacterium]
MAGFWEMGGYGAFIWPAYGVVALVMVGFWLAAWRDLRRRRDELAALEAAGLGRRRPASKSDSENVSINADEARP